ncbi:MAG: hypothetical protein LBI72_10955 [Flavobacteriaceae bacterium]|jgi:YHS domain-containing protein|nr:hypothetical protein [Flavobacteriaceae bacterium]
MKILKIVCVFALSLLAIACGEKKNEVDAKAETELQQEMQNMHQNQEEVTKSSTAKYKKGNAVPKELVCMVNDAYMGTEQLLVEFDGKEYYGCCEMCKARIPEDKSVRIALDPHTLKEVDKATAYIVMIGDKGEVAYFENEDNYKNFLATGSQG